MSVQVEVSVEGRLGVLALNRPEAINALNPGMIATITDALTRWADDSTIAAVLFEGRGTRGFCSGGNRFGRKKLCAEGEYLLRCSSTHVEAGDHGTESPRRRDCLEPRDPGTEHERPGRSE